MKNEKMCHTEKQNKSRTRHLKLRGSRFQNKEYNQRKRGNCIVIHKFSKQTWQPLSVFAPDNSTIKQSGKIDTSERKKIDKFTTIVAGFNTLSN